MQTEDFQNPFVAVAPSVLRSATAAGYFVPSSCYEVGSSTWSNEANAIDGSLLTFASHAGVNLQNTAELHFAPAAPQLMDGFKIYLDTGMMTTFVMTAWARYGGAWHEVAEGTDLVFDTWHAFSFEEGSQFVSAIKIRFYCTYVPGGTFKVKEFMFHDGG